LRPAASGSKHRGGGLPSRGPANGGTERDQPVAGPRLGIAPASTPKANFDMMRGEADGRAFGECPQSRYVAVITDILD
jgi:hypothetical protein